MYICQCGLVVEIFIRFNHMVLFGEAGPCRTVPDRFGLGAKWLTRVSMRP
jgi:hypothetical protein